MPGKYTVKEVEERTGVPSSSLRQWERRYGFPQPQRSESGYRYYSEADVAAIGRMRQLVADGVPPSRAATMVKDAEIAPARPRSADDLARELADELVRLDADAADLTLSSAIALHPLDVVLLEVTRPALVRIGNLWHAGKIDVATEHFASNFVQGRLRSLLRLLAGDQTGPLVVVACAPAEQHEMGALILALMLKRSGFRVIYLGANTPAPDLAALAEEQKADAVLLSLSTREPVVAVRRERALLRSLPMLLVLGGEALNQAPELAEEVGGVFLGNDVRQVVDELRSIIDKRATSPRTS